MRSGMIVCSTNGCGRKPLTVTVDVPAPEMRAQLAQVALQVEDLRLARGVADDRLPRRRAGGQHGVFRRADARKRQQDAPSLQIVRAADDVSAALRDLRAERAQRELDSYAEKNDASLDDYPDALVQLYARNPDARDFVRDYPKKKDLTPTIDLSGLAGSETVPLLLQWDERWGYREYNESIIGLAGCGPTCLSMVTIYLTGDTTKDPLWMCQFAEAHQFNVPGSGSKWALISEGGRMLGLDVTQIPLDKDRIYRNLDVGNPIIVVVGPGDFTTDGHFLVLTGRDGDKITLNDPNSPTNSQKSWDYDTLARQIQSLWVLRRAG
jgi:hypothetical protein